MTYAYPRMSDLGKRVKTLLTTYREAGGRDAMLLFHKPTSGRDLIGRTARRGKGLPARAIPLETHHVAAVGMDLLLGALAMGASQVALIISPDESSEYRTALRAQMDIAETIVHGLGLTGVHFSLLATDDAAVFESELWALRPAATVPAASFAFSNDKRTTLEFAFGHLLRYGNQRPAEIALPAGSPYGTLAIDHEACTLCMSCVSACPESALMDSPDYAPQVRRAQLRAVRPVREDLPEDAIKLTARLLLTPEWKQERVLNEAEPFIA
jgi:NAD-dependent dihydropyrimidine dehydrogenase PreA subunit